MKTLNANSSVFMPNLSILDVSIPTNLYKINPNKTSRTLTPNSYSNFKIALPQFLRRILLTFHRIISKVSRLSLNLGNNLIIRSNNSSRNNHNSHNHNNNNLAAKINK